MVTELKAWQLPTDAVSKVSTKKIYQEGNLENCAYHVVAIDCGMKSNIVRDLVKRDCAVTVVPWDTTYAEIFCLHPDGLFVSNGPGDPADVEQTIETIRQSIGSFPIFGICLKKKDCVDSFVEKSIPGKYFLKSESSFAIIGIVSNSLYSLTKIPASTGFNRTSFPIAMLTICSKRKYFPNMLTLHC